MSSVFDNLFSRNLLNTPPAFLKNNIHYEVITGSTAYGCNETNKSDKDIVGFAIPPKDIIFPHTAGYITDFDKSVPAFSSWQQHHIKTNNNEYDISIHNIVNFFRLCMENNPNMIDVLYVPRRCVVFSTQIGEHLRSNRQLFLHKGSFYKFRGYAQSQLSKLQAKVINKFIDLCKAHNVSIHVTLEDIITSDLPSDVQYMFNKLIKQVDTNGNRTKRVENIAKYGFDLKFAYHLVRLLCECRQILETHNLVLDKDREMYKAIRKGEWTKQQVVSFFERNEPTLEDLYNNSTLPNRPDITAIRQLLVDCLEMHYGSIEKCVTALNKHELAIRDIRQILSDRKLL